MERSFNNKVASATKWSVITELAAKLVSPVVNMVLARLLAPEAFGVVATLTMIISFAEVFTDAGFQKYIIQHEFGSEPEKTQYTTVAFWSNFALSIVIWIIIAIFSENLAALVGNPGKGLVLAIACICIPLEAFSSIQMALYKRDLDFRTLFRVRIIGILVPLVVTVPCAFLFRNYWALVAGIIAQCIVNAILLTAFSSWKPTLYYSVAKFKKMISFTFWSFLEALLVWLTNYLDIFFIGLFLSEYYLGLYKTSMALVGQITGIITSITMPLFPALSRMQNNDSEFQKTMFDFQKVLGILLMPVGVGLFCYRDLITGIFLGSQWTEASFFIGLWGLMSAVTMVLAHICSDVYRAKGRPLLSSLDQLLYLVVLIIVISVSVQYGYHTLCMARSLVRIVGILISFIIMSVCMHISGLKLLMNCAPAILSSAIMGVAACLLLMISDNIAFQLLSIVICAAVYLAAICVFPKERNIIMNKLIPEVRNRFKK